MTNYDVVKKLIGPINPLGCYTRDKERLENLKALCDLMDQIHTDIDNITYKYKDDKQNSVKEIYDYANNFLDKFSNESR